MEKKIEFLRKEIADHVARHTRERGRHRWATAAIRIGAIALSTSVTVLLGIKGYVPADQDLAKFMAIAAFIASALLTALTAWESFADHSGRWVRRKVLLGTMWGIQRDFNFHLSLEGHMDPGAMDEIYARLKACVADENEEWVARRAKAITTPLGTAQGRS